MCRMKNLSQWVNAFIILCISVLLTDTISSWLKHSSDNNTNFVFIFIFSLATLFTLVFWNIYNKKKLNRNKK